MKKFKRIFSLLLVFSTILSFNLLKPVKASAIDLYYAYLYNEKGEYYGSKDLVTWSDASTYIKYGKGRITTVQWSSNLSDVQGVCLRYGGTVFTPSYYTLSNGSSGSVVFDLQYALKVLYNKTGEPAYNIVVDGEYGTNTANAVRRFQQLNNLQYVDGVAGPETLLTMSWGWH